jgi:hypothetical protein
MKDRLCTGISFLRWQFSPIPPLVLVLVGSLFFPTFPQMSSETVFSTVEYVETMRLRLEVIGG